MYTVLRRIYYGDDVLFDVQQDTLLLRLTAAQIRTMGEAQFDNIIIARNGAVRTRSGCAKIPVIHRAGYPLSKRVNQSFVQIPFARFIDMIQYKAEELGIAVILTEESYTSGTSFIDNEAPVKENYNKARRIKRGLFVSNEGIAINADLNGAYQILKKVIPIKWDSGCALHPVVVSIF